MFSISKSKISCVSGILLILAGISVSSSTLVGSLRPKPVPIEFLEELLVGATLFRVGLIILGILLILVIGRITLRKSETQLRKTDSVAYRKLTFAALAGIILTAFGLRLYGLDYGLWFDEILTHINYMHMDFGEIITTFNSENNHVLFTLFARACFAIFGENAWSIRVPAVLFGVGSIWALYLLGSKVGSRREGLLSAALIAFSYHHIWFSQNARGYTGLLFWTILASWLFLRGLRQASSGVWLLYAGAIALGIYTHMTMIFVVMGHLIIYLIAIFFRREQTGFEQWSGFFLGFCGGGLLTLLLYALILPQVFAIIGEHSNVATWKNPVWTLVELAAGMRISFASGLVAIGALLLTGVGLASFARQRPAFIGLLFFPAVIGATTVIAMGHPLWPRFFFFAMGFGVLVIVRGTTVVGQTAGKFLNIDNQKSALLGTSLCLVLICASALSVPRAYAPKQNYEGALAFVEQNKGPGSAVVTVGLTRLPYKRFYRTDWEEVETIEKLNSIRRRAKQTWLLYTMPLHVEGEYPELMECIRNEFVLVKKFYGTLKGGTIFVCLSESGYTKSTREIIS